MTAAPTLTEIHELARRINTITRAGYVAELPDRAMTQMYAAVPGQPGHGLGVFQDALHHEVHASTTRDGAWRFHVPRGDMSRGGRGEGLLATTSNPPPGRPQHV